jgi:hypothetical protein
LTPLFTSTTPSTLLIAAATFFACGISAAGSVAYSLISIGCGTAVRSPIKSSISCASSTCTPGTSACTSASTAAMTSGVDRAWFGFSRTK